MPGDPADSIWLLHDGELQVFDECSEARAVPAPAVLGVEALLQLVDSGCGLRPYGYRCVAPSWSRRTAPARWWQLHLEELLPYLLVNVTALDKLSARAQAQREAEAELMARPRPRAGPLSMQVWEARGTARAEGGATSRCEQSLPPRRLAWAPSSSRRVRAGRAGMNRQRMAASKVQRHTWPLRESLAHLAPADRSQRASLQHDGLSAEPGKQLGVHRQPSLDLPAADGPDEGATATRGELFQLRADVLGKLDGLASEVRRYFAAASLAHSVATSASLGGGHRHTAALLGAGGGNSRPPACACGG
ncbi:hypothetical protein ABPG77_009194 [Micractinium sp. CCAP 211/92]